VRLQLDRMRQRLQHFARLEAAWRAEGWSTVAVEHRLEDAAIRLEDGFTMPVTGTVDRIDRHERTGRWRIVDYKTGDTARSPYEAHHGRKRLPPAAEARWTDLQLPLYAHLLAGRTVGTPPQTIEGPVELGYVLLPRAAARVAWEPAEWTPAHLDAALEEARRIVTEVRTGDYEPAERPPRFDRYPWIVQRPPLLLGDEGDPAALREDEQEQGETAAAGGATR
jgi:ATP-dependent helicase/nuclease subunit B